MDKDDGVRLAVELREKNWFKTGGRAAYYAEPATDSAFASLLAYARDRALTPTILGEGANVLISDAGINGLVIHPKLQHRLFDSNAHTVTAGAGVKIDDLIQACLDRGYSGLEDFSGIPGSVGGAVFINLHYFSRLIQQDLLFARVIDRKTSTIMTVDKHWFEFGYNTSRLHALKDLSDCSLPDYYLIDATFKLLPVSREEIAYQRGRREEIIRHRERRYPLERTCGSFFRNFLPEEVVHTENKIVHVAYYLDCAGARREYTSGLVRVSPQHANMLITCEGATSGDVIALARALQKKVFNIFGLILWPECRLLGFNEYPLCKRTDLFLEKVG